MRLGIFTGVGVGPGDPELMTLKAVRKILACSVIAVPVSDRELGEPVYEPASPERAGKPETDGGTAFYLENCTAYQTAVQAVPEICEKDRLYLPMPMIREKEILKRIHDMDAEAVEEQLGQGKNVVFLTLGDPTVYSTCMYVYKRIRQAGYQTELIPGVPSFCAAAAKMEIPLAENRQELHIIPASYDIGNSLGLKGTKVLMKAGSRMAEVKTLLLKYGLEAEMVENCGMSNERIYRSPEEIPDEAGYYSLLVIKEKGGMEG